ncbi:MAG: hypothetical protein Q4P18_01885 [Methanobrevibacter sp.]|uniref:hypothetical protein n=1 Tax=Methanobrevibacter sp. TaxID=66852 RepID=UPI0026E040E3|nr:hypothetical protein [Methanobrevibacter sp.]MDO5848261.1 hypothetical protein [Methanobrevibacter sp.]
MNKKINQKIYQEIKMEYVSKNCILSTLYRKCQKEYNINKIQFNQIIEKIKMEENIPQKTARKVKRMNNPFSYHDKHPDSYFELTYTVS